MMQLKILVTRIKEMMQHHQDVMGKPIVLLNTTTN